jgi:hypothetical protein
VWVIEDEDKKFLFQKYFYVDWNNIFFYKDIFIFIFYNLYKFEIWFKLLKVWVIEDEDKKFLFQKYFYVDWNNIFFLKDIFIFIFYNLCNIQYT